MSGGRLHDLWRRGQRGWPERYPVVQLANPPLLVAFTGRAVAAASGEPGRSYAQAAYWIGLTAWGWAELASGANVVRRAFGAAGLAYVAYERVRAVTAVGDRRGQRS